MSSLFILLMAFSLEYGTQQYPTLKRLAQFRQLHWLSAYLRWILGFLKDSPFWRPYATLACTLGPIILLISLVLWISSWIGGAIGSFILGTVILYYSLGGHENESNESPLIMAHERSFGVIFWFLVIGPIGALMYRLLTFCRLLSLESDSDTQMQLKGVDILHGLAAWIPSRVTGLIYALVGDFQGAYEQWQRCMRQGKMNGSQVLLTCGESALNQSQAAEKMVQRALIAWLCLGVFLILAGWTY